jgi:predicted DNA binding protein
MTVVARIAIDAEDFVIGRVLSHTSTRIKLTQLVPINDALTPYFWKETDGDREAFERTVRADDHVKSLTDLDGRVGARLYHIEWEGEINGVLSALQTHGILVEEAKSSSSGDRWLFHLRAWDQGELSGFQQACFDHDVALDVQRVHHNPTGSMEDGIGRGLTEKQREALLLALREGYFDVPRRATQTDIADELGVARQSFARLLKRAQRTVFEDLFWEELEAN